jgi:glutamine synthetase
MTADDPDDHASRLRSAGARLLCGMISDSGGVLRAKAVPAARIEAFGRAGMGASLTWPVFCVDNHVAMTADIGVTGDLRLVADLAAGVVLDSGFGWAPADVHTQDGEVSPLCWRDVARRQVSRLAATGVEVRAGYEMEFTVMDSAGARVDDQRGWIAYGAGEFSALSGFATDIVDRLASAGVPVEQVHAEYGVGQYELSLPPRPALAAADAVLLARTVVGRVARERGLLVSFSPMPFSGGIGNGAHLHVSFTRRGVPLLSGGTGPAGLTPGGEHLVAGLVEHLPETIAVLAGSVVSTERLAPGHWSGAFSCWGVENREAAVRLLTATNGNPHGANVEVKCIDGAANPYLAVGLLLGIATDGLQDGLPLPREVPGDPAALSDREAEQAHLRRLPATLPEVLSAFGTSTVTARILGPQLQSAIVAVRTHELTAYADADPYTQTRFAWSA